MKYSSRTDKDNNMVFLGKKYPKLTFNTKYGNKSLEGITILYKNV